MIIELRIYRLKSGSSSIVEERYAEVMPARTKFSPLGGFWRTIIGPVDQIIHAWPYQDLAERSRVRTESMKDGTWPPKIAEFLGEQETAIMIPAPFSPPLSAQQLGPIYEICTDTYATGALRRVLPAWKDNIGTRTKLSPLVACWFSELGAMNRLVHIWSYPDMSEWQRIHNEAERSGAWPIPTSPELKPLKQDSLIAVPLSFSPLK